MRDVFTVLLAGGRGQRLDPLTRERAKPAVPFGATYRIIDFTLSNCVNSGLDKVLTLVQYRSRSLNEHVRLGWSPFFNPRRGQWIETLPPQQNLGDRWYAGTADAVYQNLFAIREENPDLVLVLSGDHIYKMDYRNIVRQHREKKADVTVAAVEVPKSEASAFGILAIDNDSRILKFQEKPKKPETVPEDPSICLASMGIYVFNASTMYQALEADAGDKDSEHDFGKNVLPRLMNDKRMFAFRFIDENTKGNPNKYWRDVGTLDAYYDANMDLIHVTPELNLYDPDWPVYRRATMAPPPKFIHGGADDPKRTGTAFDSLVAPGTILSGSQVHRSIISPNCKINSYAEVEDSIIFSRVNIGRGAKIRRAILDKDVVIPEGMKIGYDLESDRKLFTVSANGIVAIPKGQKL
jgi:glucose-1-phosphate adenylyltransferase